MRGVALSLICVRIAFLIAFGIPIARYKVERVRVSHMKLTSKRFTDLTKKLRSELVKALQANDDARLAKCVKRLNKVCYIQRVRNIRGGAPLSPWVDNTIEQVKSQAKARGLI